MSRTAAVGIPFAATFDSSITTDPNAAAIEASITAAMNQLTNTFTATGRLNSSNPVAIKFQAVTTGLASNASYNYDIHYNLASGFSYRSALAAGPASAFDITALSTLPNTAINPVNGTTFISVNTALIRELGGSPILYSNTPNGGLDAVINLNLSIMNLSRTGPQNSAKYDLQSAVEHEIDEVLGLGSGLQYSPTIVTPQDLFRYTAAGARSVTTSDNDAYFSLNQTTDLVRFNQTPPGDYGDWWSITGTAVPRVQNSYLYPGTQPAYGVEAIALDAIGYTLTGAANLDLNNINFSGMSLAGTAPTNFTASNFTGANLSTTNLTKVNLSNANLTSANCSSANFTGANCTNTNFTSAILSNANLTGATLTGANFTNAAYVGAIICCADTRGAVNFVTTGLVQANAVLPDGTLNNPAISGTNLILGTSPIPVQAVGTALTISSGSYFDIGNNSVILEDGTSLPAVLAFVAGQQIRSSAVLANKGVGYLSGVQYLATHGPGALFAGVAVLPEYVLLSSAPLGDANLDGVISIDDYLLLDRGFLMGASNPGWFNGDFNGDGTVNVVDYAMIDASFRAQSGTFADGMIALHSTEFGQTYVAAMTSYTGVPEPGSLLMLASGSIALGSRRRGSRRRALFNQPK